MRDASKNHPQSPRIVKPPGSVVVTKVSDQTVTISMNFNEHYLLRRPRMLANVSIPEEQASPAKNLLKSPPKNVVTSA